jgi:hypothetical protein
MARYNVNKNAQTNGDHEVHTDSCIYLPSNRIDLGLHDKCQDAVREAKKHYTQVNGCAYCSAPCHTQ